MTPGPWKWFHYPDGRKLLSGPNRAVIHCPDAAMAVDKEDARAIEAVPELVVAVEALCYQIAVGWIAPEDIDDYKSEGAWQMACDAHRDAKTYADARMLLERIAGR